MNNPPLDQAVRARFREELGRNFAVAASAGSGKTTAISERLASLARVEGAARILKRTAVVTYTKKAASQIGQRARTVLLRRLGEDGVSDFSSLDALECAFFGTIHSFCLLLAQRYGRNLGINLNPTVADGEDEELIWEDFIEGDPMEFSSLEAGQVDAFLRHVSLESVFDLARDLDLSTAERMVRQKPDGLPPPPDEAAYEAIQAATSKGVSLPLQRNKAQVARWRDQFLRREGHLPLPKPEGTAGGIRELYARCFRPVKAWLAQAGGVLAAELALRYRDWRFERGVQTYADQIDAALAVLREPATLEAIRAEGWRVVLDEAQDTDPKQFSVLVEITRPPGSPLGSWPEGGPGPRPGHFCMVGDPQQSIYGSRADVRNFERHMRAFASGDCGEKLVFSTTFRTPVSVARLLNRTLPEAFGPHQPHNRGLPPEEGAPEKLLQVSYEPLIPGPANGEGAVVRIDVPQSGGPDLVEARLAREVAAIAAFLASKGFASLGASSWGDLCILAPRNDWLLVAKRGLEDAGLKTSVQMRRNRSGDSPPYAWVCGLLAVVCDPSDTYEWVGVLREIFAVSDDAIAAEVRRERQIHWDEPERHGPAFQEALATLAPFIARVDEEGDCLDRFARDLVEACGLRERARALDPSGQIEGEVDELLADASERGLAGEGVRGWRRHVFAAIDKTRPSGRAAADSINLLTSHSAKGLEWSVVIPIGLWRPIKAKEPTGFRLIADPAGERRVYFDGDSLSAETRESRERERKRELVRLLYVTMTRARGLLALPWREGDVPEDGSFASLWGADLEALSSALPPPAPTALVQVPGAEGLTVDTRSEEASGLLPPLPRRLLPHQLSSKSDAIRSIRHESSQDEPVMTRGSEDPIEYGLWWHETMEFLPWEAPSEVLASYFTLRLEAAAGLGCEVRGRAEWELLMSGDPFRLMRQSRWTRSAEVSVFAPFTADAWIDGVMDLVLQDRTTGEVLIVDWKTNARRLGEKPEEFLNRLSNEYRSQLEAYAVCAGVIFPTATVRVFLYASGVGRWIQVPRDGANG